MNPSLKHAMRGLAVRPLMSLVIAIVLSLAIGANTYLGVTFALVVTALAAAIVPTRRAILLPPTVAIRED